MNDLAKILIVTGVGIAAVGLLIALLGKIPGVGRLPGDILVKKENFTFFFPLTTCILLSLLLSFLFWVFRK